MSAAAVLARLLSAGCRVEVEGERVRLREPRPGMLRPEHLPAFRALRLPLHDLGAGSWRATLAAWPAWRREVFEERAALREYDGGQPRDLAERCAFLEALEAPEPPPPHLAPPPTEPSRAPGPRSPPPPPLASPAPIEAPAVDLEEPEELPAKAPPRFQHRYRTPPEQPALPPFRWSVPLPPARRADAPAYHKPPPPAPAPAVPPCPPAPLRSLADPHEPPERRAARFGYRIDAFGSWLEPGEASVPPFLPRFAVGHRRTPEEEREASALLDRIRTYCAQVIDRTPAVDGPEETRSLTVNESRGGLPQSGPGARGPVARTPGASTRAVGAAPPRP